jgi:hypothetical protein
MVIVSQYLFFFVILFLGLIEAQANTRGTAAIYCRVSSREQVLGSILDEQKWCCREHLKTLRLKYYTISVDEGFSGRNLDQPAIQNMYEDIMAGGISHVIVWRLDRLSRNPTDTLLLVNNQNGVGIGILGNVVEKIFRKYIELESIGKLRKLFDVEGIPTRGGYVWTITTIGAILVRRIYLDSVKGKRDMIKCWDMAVEEWK